MNNQTMSVLRFNLFNHSKDSFLTALDEAGIPHSSTMEFSSRPQGGGFVEAISSLTEAMPWNAIAKVIIAWINARKSRSVMIQMTDGSVTINAHGHSATDIENLLKASINISVIDTTPNNVALDSEVDMRNG